MVDRCVGTSWTPATGSAMDLARYVVDAVVLKGRSYREVAAAHGVITARQSGLPLLGRAVRSVCMMLRPTHRHRRSRTCSR